jgi:ABC-2 type transport system ATP-binding protein
LFVEGYADGGVPLDRVIRLSKVVGHDVEVEVNDLVQGYGGAPVIRGLTMTLRTGVTALLGPNGAGKSTLLRTLATVLPPRSGGIVVDGVMVQGESSARAVRDQIGYLPQSFGYDPRMRLIDFVEYAAWLRGVPSVARAASASAAVELVDLTDQRRTRMGKLSGGMRQRAGIAWAVVGSPKVVLLDEPTVGLDPRQRLQFRKIISSLTDAVVLLSTHLIDDVSAICDDVLVMHGGEVKFSGPVTGLAELDRIDLPGHTPLERAYMNLLPEQDQRL